MKRKWSVIVIRHPKSVLLGFVHADGNDAAKKAALKQYAISEDEYFTQLAAKKEPHGISPGDTFVVSPTGPYVFQSRERSGVMDGLEYVIQYDGLDVAKVGSIAFGVQIVEALNSRPLTKVPA